MEIDDHTLADLELLPSGQGADTLFQTLDHTATPGGRAALWKYLRSPRQTVPEIQQRQKSLQSLIPTIALLDIKELAPLIHQVERYLSSSFLPLPSSAIQRLLFQFRYADMLEHLTHGINALGEFLEIAQNVGDCLESFPVEQSEIHALAAKIRECVDMPVHLQLQAVRRKSRPVHHRLGRFDWAIRGNSATLERIRSCISALHDFDALRSLAVISSQPGWSFPEVIESSSPVFEANGLFHPLVHEAVANSIVLGSRDKVLYLTGPNMAGKTTFMKSCAIAVLLSHTGAAVPAEAVRLSAYQRLYTALTARDSIVRSESFFLAEVRRVKTLVEYVAGGQRVFAVVDEMFRGTNILDASDGTYLIVTGLARSQNSVHIIASHITDITALFEKNPGIKLACFDGEIRENDMLYFSYQIKPGVSTRRLGLEFLNREDVLQLLESIE